LSPTDPPILLAGLIAARRSGDRLLAKIMERELEQCGIAVRFVHATPRQKGEAEHAE
jgi:hypothetical protein